MGKNKTVKRRILNHLGNVGMATITLILMTTPSLAVDPAKAVNQATGTEGAKQAGKEALNAALKIAKSKPAMSTATGIL